MGAGKPYHEKVVPNQFKIHIFATVKTKMSLLFWCINECPVLLELVLILINRDPSNVKRLSFWWFIIMVSHCAPARNLCSPTLLRVRLYLAHPVF